VTLKEKRIVPPTKKFYSVCQTDTGWEEREPAGEQSTSSGGLGDKRKTKHALSAQRGADCEKMVTRRERQVWEKEFQSVQMYTTGSAKDCRGAPHSVLLRNHSTR